MTGVIVSADARAYVYSYRQLLSTLYLVQGPDATVEVSPRLHEKNLETPLSHVLPA